MQWTVATYTDGQRLPDAAARDYADAWRIALVKFEDTEVQKAVIVDHFGRVAYSITTKDADCPVCEGDGRLPVITRPGDFNTCHRCGGTGGIT